MSPASQGNLQVERYIGSCLISARLNNKCVSSANYKNKKVGYGSPPGGWTGMPLIQCRPRTHGDVPRTPLSRLAIHTQGAPLILAGHYNGRKNNRAPPHNRKVNGDPTSSNNLPSSDSISVASDESSGHSENSLPRIIKPRKRRKKERKPPATPSSESSTIVTLKPYVPLCHDLYDGHRAGRNPEEDEKVTEEEVNLQHNAEDVKHGDAQINTLFPYRCAPSVCQCRYCDPSGLIWDVDQHCYSPFLTPPSLEVTYSAPSFATFPLFFSPPLDLYNKDLGDSSSPLEHKEPVRRSWSEPFSASAEFGVIGGGRKDARHFSASSDCSLSQSLEVSTEIVTSLNGHRDIEIKFYSSSPPSVVVDAVHYRNGCESDDDVNTWSSCKDVWADSDSANVSDSTWGVSWETLTEQTATDTSVQLSDEVNQLCLGSQ